MAPDRHVARVRRKLPGHHNRRFKGKNRSEDKKKALREQRAAVLNQLPFNVAFILRTLEKDITEKQRPLLDAVGGLLTADTGFPVPSIWIDGEAAYVAYTDACVVLRLVDYGISAECIADDDYRWLFDQHSVVLWLRRVAKQREVRC
jgi:hypothetical protein